MKNLSVDIPGNDEIVFSVNPSQIDKIIKENKYRVKGYEFTIFGKKYFSLREDYRRDLVKIARSFTNQLDAENDQKKQEDYLSTNCLIITGHQPEFYHPGIWIKNLFLSEIIKNDKTGQNIGLNLNLDNDIVNQVHLYCPHIDKPDKRNDPGYALREVNLYSHTKNIPLQEIGTPSNQELNKFVLEVNSEIEKFPNRAIYNRFQKFTSYFWKARQICQSDLEMNQLGIFLITCRRYHESSLNPAYYEVPHSFLHNHDTFLLFLLEIAAHIYQFAFIYNQKVAQYRTLHKIKNKVNPVTDLLIEKKRVEAPFWIWQKGKKMGREKLFFSMEKDGQLYIDLKSQDKILLISSKKENGNMVLQRLKGIIKQNDFVISPRALILTLFQRLFGADLFIHGIGCSKYDWITDRIIRDYFKVEPPEFFTISTTIPLDLPSRLKSRYDSSLWKKKKRALTFNPETLIREAGLSLRKEQDAQALIDEKMKLTEQIRNIASKEKHDFSQRIKELNKRLKIILDPYEREINKKIAEEKKKREQEKIIKFREYPYCFYDSRKIVDLLKKKMRGEC